MKSFLLAAGVLAAVAAGASSVRAADLDYAKPDRYSSPYDDPRYRELYGERRYTERYQYEDRGNKYPAPAPYYGYRDDGPSRRFAEDDRYRRDCVPRHAIREKLRAEGWGDFHDLDLRPEIAAVRARRPSGELYDLKIDRCTGSIVSARPLDRYVPGPYAHGPRRWTRPYY